MHQLAVLSTGWVAFFHLAPDGAHHSRFQKVDFFLLLTTVLFFSFLFFVLGRFSWT
jgi:hypothetical protein